MKKKEIKELREEFFKEHCYKCENGIPRVVTHPHNLFEWIVEKLVIIEEEGEDEEIDIINSDGPWNWRKDED